MTAIPARLKWIMEKARYVAYPAGFDHQERRAEVQFLGRMTLGHEIGVPRWRWSVQWPGWFSAGGYGESKQDSADKATEAWWNLITTSIPRDVDTEIDVIVARILVMPPPNSVLSEGTAFLHRLNWMLFERFKDEIRAEATPMPVRNLLAGLSEELYRRRLAGESEAPATYGRTT